MASRSSILGSGVPATSSTQKQTVPSLSVNKNVVPDGSSGALQSSSGSQQNWCGVPGQMSMPLLSVASLESSVLVADAVNSHENSHAEENTSSVTQTAIPSERHLEVLQDNSHFNDGLLQNSSTYQSQVHSYDADEAVVGMTTCNREALR